MVSSCSKGQMSMDCEQNTPPLELFRNYVILIRIFVKNTRKWAGKRLCFTTLSNKAPARRSWGSLHN